jgi:hypothetical protein
MPQIRNVFQALTKENPSPALRETILLRIAMEETLLLKQKRSLALFGLLTSFVALSVIGLQYGTLFLQSDFWMLLSLLFSDLGLIATSFQDFFYSLLETLPVGPLLLLFLPLTLFFWSMSHFFSSKRMERVFDQAIAH